jgi:protein disulfide-isomerase
MIQVDVWSDVLCPFCYIGKRHFEKALEQFSDRDQVKINWHSFQLDPFAQKNTGQNIYEMLAKKYGRDVEWAKSANERVIMMAKESGLNFEMEKMTPTNSFDAHRLIHLAKTQNLQDQIHERLFSAVFIEGKDISDHATLIQIGKAIGLDEKIVDQMLKSTDFKEEVNRDRDQAVAGGINAVPAFVFNQKYLVSGAQPVETFAQVFNELVKNNTSKDYPIS